VLVSLNIVGVQEAAKLSISLAVVDFATQLLLVAVGFALVLTPETLVENVHWGTAPTWSSLAVSIPVAMLAYTGVETVSNLAEEARDPVRTVPSAYKVVAAAVFAIYFTLPLVALGAAGGADRRRADDAARPSAGRGRLRERSHPRGRREPRARGRLARRRRDRRRPARGDDPLHRDERRRDRSVTDTYAMASYRQLPEVLRRLRPRFKTPWLSLVLFAGIAPILVLLRGT
jgi:APA family basic amino acid/polyamine antiporter